MGYFVPKKNEEKEIRRLQAKQKITIYGKVDVNHPAGVQRPL